MADEARMYLSVGREKVDARGYLSVISLGHPQRADDTVTVLAVNVLPNMKAAKAWYRQMKSERPWETRQ